MTRGMPAIWSSIVAAPFLFAGAGITTGHLETAVPSRFGPVGLGVGAAVVALGCYVHLVGAAGFEPAPRETDLAAAHPVNRFAQAKSLAGLAGLGLAAYWLFFTRVPYVYPTVALLGGALLFGTGIWTYWVNTLTTYHLTDERLVIERRLLGSNVDEVLLQQVKTDNVYRPFYLRVFGLGNVTLDTGARRRPVVRHIRESDTFAEEMTRAIHDHGRRKGR